MIKKNGEYKIMIVEDEAVIALSLQQSLIKMGYNVIGISYSGKDALDKARSLVPDLILMDIRLPGKMDGIRVAEIVKSELDIPVIFLTAFSEDQIINRAKKAEPFGYILKPIQEREIKAAVELALYKIEMEKTLKESEKKFRTLAGTANDGILIASGAGKFVYANKEAAEITGYSISALLKKTIKDLSHPDEFEQTKERYFSIISGKPFKKRYETKIIHKTGKEIPIDVTSARFSWEGQPADIVIIRDLTERVRAENALKKAHDELEAQVKKRTRELEAKTESLEELNTAMKVLLKKREEDKQELEDNVLTNLKEMIEPYFDKLMTTKLDDQQRSLLSILNSNLNEITSPFTRKMSLKYLNLTPKESQIVNLIKHGKTTKQIAKLMNASPRTIDTHRKNIRKKIGLRGQKSNLRSYLLSLQ